MNINWNLIVLNIGVTALIYCIIPIVLVLSGHKYDHKQATKIAAINSLIICIFFIIFNSAFFNKTTVSSAAFLYFPINYAILKSKNPNNNLGKHASQKDETSNSNTNNTKYIPLSDFILVISALLIFIVVISFIYFNKLSTYQNELSERENQIKSLQEDISLYEYEKTMDNLYEKIIDGTYE